MAVRKKRAASKKASRRKASPRKSRPRGPAAALAAGGLPRSLREARRAIGSNLNHLEKQLSQARALYRRRTARLLREASQQLGRLEARGERGWIELSTRARTELAQLLRRLERAVAPPPKRAGRKKKA